ncbi:isoprenylcysteine carboxylmethyltransferase family protein [Proteobacteria bacterium 005FR1]|nr:isoprenylcysteine carboxylmethyltransferase family protein [Proteobacteria bacterium 005FR1]
MLHAPLFFIPALAKLAQSRSHLCSAMPFASPGALYFSLWLASTVVLGVVSRRSLRNPRCHGFYRFFAFSASAAVVIPNLEHWHDRMWAPHQLLSWLLLFSALGLLVPALYLLKTRGGEREAKPAEHFAFENTAKLIETGVFRWVRHPMYSALMLFTWGVWLKNVSLPGLALCAATTTFLWLTARVEEQENQRFFGDAYAEYSKQTKAFIPLLF